MFVGVLWRVLLENPWDWVEPLDHRHAETARRVCVRAFRRPPHPLG